MAKTTLASARAYYRLAAKARRAGNYRLGDHYYGIAERKVAKAQREREWAAKLTARQEETARRRRESKET